jgi:hypothetical protein
MGLALAAFSSLGCGESGPAYADVEGKVLLDGKPLTKGFVTTQPAAGRGANGAIQSDGTFELNSGRIPGALVGTHAVAVVAHENPGAEGAEADMGRLLVPQRYVSASSSPLSIDVQEDGENAPVLELTSK